MSKKCAVGTAYVALPPDRRALLTLVVDDVRQKTLRRLIFPSTLHQLVNSYVRFEASCFLHLQGQAVQEMQPKRFTSLHDVTSQKT